MCPVTSSRFPRKIDQLLQNGGTITLAGGQVITRTGSQLNLDGGYIHYLGGVLQTTKLVAANGSVIDIANADPNGDYIGMRRQTTTTQSRWNITTTYVNPLLTGAAGSYETDYIQGGSAGTLNIYGQTASLSMVTFPRRRLPAVTRSPAPVFPVVARSTSVRQQRKVREAVLPDSADLPGHLGPSYVLEDMMRPRSPPAFPPIRS